MASSDPRKDLECSICLNVYTDPTTLRCGHNFCRGCIDRVLETQEESGGLSCPECRQEFQERPSLQRNITLCNIVDNLPVLSAQPGQEPEIFCTYCIHTPVSAVVSCVLCEASLCDNHLKVHSKSPEHVLCDPTTSLETRKCSVHKKILEYYCAEDSVLICVSCSVVGEHQGHQLETLEDASQKKREKHEKLLQMLITKRKELKMRVRNLKESKRQLEEKASSKAERVTVLFRDLRRQLEDLKRKVLGNIFRFSKNFSTSFSNMILELEMQTDETFSKICRVEKLIGITDPLTILQERDIRDACEAEDEYDYDRESHKNLSRDERELELSWFSNTLHLGLYNIMSGLNLPPCTDAQFYVPPSTTRKGHGKAKYRQRVHPSTTVQRSCSQVAGPLYRDGEVVRSTRILMDVNTAGSFLHISEDMRTASTSDRGITRPGSSERFQVYPQVLSSQRFRSGRHYWEVDAGESVFWRVGVCYPSIDRKGGDVIGYNNKSWSVQRWCNNKYSVMHDRKKIGIPGQVVSNRVRLDLDYEAGWVAFFEVCPSGALRHLHTFTAAFTEPLHAEFGVWENSITLSGANQR